MPTFPRAKSIFARDEFEFWKRESETGREAYDLIDDSVLPIVTAGVAELVPSDYFPVPGRIIAPGGNPRFRPLAA